MQYIVPLYLLLINAASLVIMCLDKRYAKIGHRRIPEARLLLLAFLGGSFGVQLGMWVARHKTETLKFRATLPVLMPVQALLALYLLSL